MGEANALLVLAAKGLGLVRARAQGVRKAGAKLAPALTTLSESDVSLVKGKEGWRIAGAVLREPWFSRLKERDARLRIARVHGLLLRLAPADTAEHDFYELMQCFYEVLETVPTARYEAAELMMVLQLLSRLGLAQGAVPDLEDAFSEETLCAVDAARVTYIHRINQGIAASGL